MKTLVMGLFLLFCSESHAQSIVRGQVHVASQYNFRGVPQNIHGVVQPQLEVTIATSKNRGLQFIAWGNVDITDDPGNAALPSGNGSHLSEVDFIGAYSDQLGVIELTAGVTSYNFPGGGASTSEMHVEVGLGVFGVSPHLAAYYDFDRVDGWYVNGGVTRSQSLGEHLDLDIYAALGITDADHAYVYYGTREAGFADLTVAMTLTSRRWSQTDLGVSVQGSQVLGAGKQAALAQASIDDQNVWAGVTLARRF